MTTALATAHRPVSAMVPFVCAVIGSDANEPLHHIIVRKEAERKAGSGEFWWGLSAPLGRDVEACANGVTLPALFSASNVAAQHGGQVKRTRSQKERTHPKPRCCVEWLQCEERPPALRSNLSFECAIDARKSWLLRSRNAVPNL
jgi:hypothetical protein